MTPKEIKLNAVMDDLNGFIESNSEFEKLAMKVLEHLNPTKEQYKEASEVLMRASFANNILNRIKDIAESGDIKRTEQTIRFHAYQLSTKATLNAGDVISVAQQKLFQTLEYMIYRHFKIS